MSAFGRQTTQQQQQYGTQQRPQQAPQSGQGQQQQYQMYSPQQPQQPTITDSFGRQYGDLGGALQQRDAFMVAMRQNPGDQNAAYNQATQMSQQGFQNFFSNPSQGNVNQLFQQFGMQAPPGLQQSLDQRLGQQSQPSAYPGFPSPQAGPTGGYPGFPAGGGYPNSVLPAERPPSPYSSGPTGGYPGGDYGLPGQVGQPAPGGGPALYRGGPALYRPGPQSGPTGPQGEYYPGGPMTPAAPQRNERGAGDDWGFQPFAEPPQTAAQQRRSEQLRVQAERAVAGMRQPQTPAPAPEMNSQDRANQRRLDEGWEVNTRPDGTQEWLSPQRATMREEYNRRAAAARPVEPAPQGTAYQPQTPYALPEPPPPQQSQQQPQERSYDTWFRDLMRRAPGGRRRRR